MSNSDGPLKSLLWCLAPLAVLAADVARVPNLFHTRDSGETISVRQIVEDGIEEVHLGRLRGHEFHLSHDEIRAPDFLAGDRDRRNALVVTHFLTATGGDSRYGLLGRATRQRLRDVDVEAERQFVQMVQLSPGANPGDAKRVMPQRQNVTDFPVWAIYIVLLAENGTGAARSAALEEGMTNVFRFAGEDGIDNLVVPALGIDENAAELPFADFLQATFAATPMGGAPRNVHLSWYPRWQTRTVEAATRALTNVRAATFSHANPFASKLESPLLRLACLALALCLLTSSRAVTLSFERFLIISAAYLAAFAGIWGLVGLFAVDQGADLVFTLRAASVLALAAAFRWIVKWDVKNLFAGGGDA